MKTSLTLLVLLLFMFIGVGRRPARGDDTAAVPELTKQFQPWDRPEVPGGAVAIVRDGQVVVARGFGSANLDDRVPISTQSVFEMGSVAKSFVCAALALLMDQGKVHPDDDIHKFLPEMPLRDPPIRVRHLVRCETGLPDYWFAMQLAGWDIEDAYTSGDVLALLTRWKSLPPSGSRHAYSSSDYFLLGLVIERVSGQSLAQFTRKNLFEPLQMTRTHFEDDPSLVVAHRVIGYDRLPGGGFRRWNMNARVVGGCGLKSCIEDQVRWIANFDANKLPRGKYMDEFFVTGTLLGNRNVLDLEPTGAYRGLTRIQFTGGMPGFGAAIVYFPKQRFAIICLSNSDMNPFAQSRQIVDRYLASMFTKPPSPLPSSSTEPVVVLSADELQDKIGDYRLSDGRIWRLEVRDGVLSCVDNLHDVHPLQPLSSTRFRASNPAGATTYLFSRRQSNEPYSFTVVNDNGQKYDCQRVELVSPTVEQLAEYSGVFFNDELLATYRFAVRDGLLHLQVNNRRWERLDPTLRDQFVPHLRSNDDNRIFKFLRDDAARVTGFTLDLWRVRDVRFRKQRDE